MNGKKAKVLETLGKQAAACNGMIYQINTKETCEEPQGNILSPLQD